MFVFPEFLRFRRRPPLAALLPSPPPPPCSASAPGLGPGCCRASLGLSLAAPMGSNRSARCMAQRRVSACKARRLALSLAPRPAVLPPAAPRAPWPSPLPGAALSRSSVNSMRGWLFGGWPPLRALRVPGSLPALPPGSLRSSGVVRRADGLRPKKPGWARGPMAGCALKRAPAPRMVRKQGPVKGAAPRPGRLRP